MKPEETLVTIARIFKVEFVYTHCYNSGQATACLDRQENREGTGEQIFMARKAWGGCHKIL